jgi:hypothetical protein
MTAWRRMLPQVRKSSGRSGRPGPGEMTTLWISSALISRQEISSFVTTVGSMPLTTASCCARL